MNTVLVDLAEVDLPDWLPPVEPFCQEVLRRLQVDGWELSVLFCADPQMQELNRRYRGIDQATDVLSFPQAAGVPAVSGGETAELVAGDIAIAVQYAQRQAHRLGVAPGEEVRRLLIHGILHLNGLSHGPEESPENRPPGSMLELQERLLAEIGEPEAPCLSTAGAEGEPTGPRRGPLG